jgi:hypothetical protein
MVPKMLSFDGGLANFGVTGISRCWGRYVVVTDTYDTCTLRVWYLSTDILFILLHVKFEDGLFISVLKKQGNSSQKLTNQKS